MRTARAASTRSSSPSAVSGTRRPSMARCSSWEAAPGPSRSGAMPRWATCRAWPRGDCPRGFGSATRPARRSRRFPDWEHRLAATARLTRRQDVRLISGMPSWMLVLFERIRSLGRSGAPAGPAMAPPGRLHPRRRPDGSVPGRLRGCDRATDPLRRGISGVGGLRGIQIDATDPGLTLMLDYGNFYEFVPVTELGSTSARRLNIAEVRVGEPYAVLLTTPAGLWSYVLGDTVRFVSLDPPQLVITGRTSHFVNAFGENVIVEEVERAAVAACARTQRGAGRVHGGAGLPAGPHAAAPSRVGCRVSRPPVEPRGVRARGRRNAQALNTDYRTKRAGNVGMAPRA